MALGRRKKERQQDFWISTDRLPRSEGHVFYRRLNALLLEADTIGPSVAAAQDHLIQAESDTDIEEVVADKGYHKNETLSDLEFTEGLRTYVAEPKQTHRRNWKNKPEEQRQAVLNNRRRTKGKRGRALQRKRSERVERSFAHVCESGGSRRTWLRGIKKVRKRYLMSAMARNLGLVMRRLFGFGTARSLQAEGGLAGRLHVAWFDMQSALARLITTINRVGQKPTEAPTANRSLALTHLRQLRFASCYRIEAYVSEQ